jgi:hypothetical protein
MQFGMGNPVIRSLESTDMGQSSDRPHIPQIPEIGFCAEKNRLMNDFIETIHQLGELQTQQAGALINGDPDFARFDLLIHVANEKKNQVKYAWLSHIEQHGC